MRNLHYVFTSSSAPVQAEGKICGQPFHFRTGHQGWSFAVSENPAVSPADIRMSGQGEAGGFFMEGEFGNEEFSAGHMPLEAAIAIIEHCAGTYVSRKFG